MMTTLVISSMLLAAAGVAWAWTKGGMPESVSSIVYAFGKGGRWLWTLWLWAVTALLTPALLEGMPEGFTVLGFLTSACLLLTGAVPVVRSEKNALHNVVGVAAGVFSQACVAFLCPWLLCLWVVMLWATGAAFLNVLDDGDEMPVICAGKGVFVAEMICAATVFGSLLVRLAEIYLPHNLSTISFGGSENKEPPTFHKGRTTNLLRN